MARKNVIFVYDPDPRYYVTREVDRVTRRRWYRVWFLHHDEINTQRDEMQQLVAAMIELRLDPGKLRLPSEDEKRADWQPPKDQ